MILYNSVQPDNFSEKNKRIPAATILRKTTDPHIYGIKRLGSPMPFAKMATLQIRLNERKYGYSWNNASFLEHCHGKNTLYYYSRFQVHVDDDKTDAELLPEDCICPYFDIDINKSRSIGTAENAASAIALLETHFPGIYSENNRRAYPLIYNDGYSREQVKAILKKLELLLDGILTKQCGIERFEIKGLPCDIWREKGLWHVDNYGTLGKLPTQLLDRFEEWYGQPIIRMSALEKMVSEQTKPVEVVGGGRSTTNIIFSEAQLEMLPEVMKAYTQHSYYCMAMRKTDPAAARKITARKFQSAFVILSMCSLKPNKNGQLPTAKIAAIWQYLYQNGHEEIGHFHGSVWKCIRDTLADCGFLEMVNNKYWFSADGTKGKSMEWELKSEFCHNFKQHTHIYMDNIPDFVPFRWRPQMVWKNEGLDYEDLRAMELEVQAIFQQIE